MSQASTPTPTGLPQGIQIFRAGRHTDDAGHVHEFSPADLAAMATGYQPTLREAPLTVGHPKDNLPAYGWVQGLSVQGNTLLMQHHQVDPQFAEMVNAGRFKKRSASFYPPASPNNPTPGQWYLRHVAFLGAQPPAVAGLKDIQFCEGDAADGAVCFSEPVTTPQERDDMSKELQEQLAQAQAELAAAQAATAQANAAAAAATAQAASFAERARAERRAGFASFAEGQVQAGRLLPKDKDMAVATLDALADAAPVEFAEGGATRKLGPAQWLQELIANAKPVVSFGEMAAGGAPAQPGQSKGKSDAEIDRDAKAWARQHAVSYAQALGAVTSSFTG